MERHARQSKTNQGINLKYTTPVTIPYGQLQAMIDWCQNNCVKDWNFTFLKQDKGTPWEYEFTFKSKKDYVTFCLWKK